MITGKINRNKQLQKYLLVIVLFSLASINLYFRRFNFGIKEAAFVNYGIACVLYFCFQHVFFSSDSILKKYYKQIFCFILNLVLIAGISYGVGSLIWDASDKWTIFCNSSFLALSVYTIETLVLYFIKRISYDICLLILILSLGTGLTVVLPVRTGISWDDQIHYARALSVSNGFSSEINCADELLIYTAYDSSSYEEMTYEQYINKINKMYKNNKKCYSTVESVPFQSAITYMPSAAGLMVGRGLGFSYSIVFIIGRWMNLLFYAIFMYLAMRQLKSGKMILAVFALLPTNLFLATNYSYDYWIISLTVFSICYFIGLIQNQDKKMKYEDMLIIFGSMLVALMPKSTYFLLFILFALVNPKKKFTTKKQMKIYYIFLTISMLIAIAWFVFPFLFSGTGGNDMRGGVGVDSTKQISFILHHPLIYTKTLLQFLGIYWSLPESVYYMHNWAYMGLIKYQIISLLLVVFAVVVDKNESDVELSGFVRKIIWCIVALGISSINATALYVAFTPVGAKEIEGCTPRYLLPIIFPTLYMLGSYVVTKPIPRGNVYVIKGIVIAISTILLAYATWSTCILN